MLSAHLRREPESMMRLMQLVADKLRDIESVASSLALHDVEERLRRTLVRLARRQSRMSPTASQSLVLAPVPTQSSSRAWSDRAAERSPALSAMARDSLVSSERAADDPGPAAGRHGHGVSRRRRSTSTTRARG
ncbi:MAG: hypothetical protein U0168_26020 [Nannocystaceae bacterium]